MKKIKKVLNSLIDAIYPPKCIFCGQILEKNTLICYNCDSVIKRVNIDNFCLKCGIQKDFCECNHKIFRFNSIVCAFENSDSAKKVYYNYKFHRKQHYYKFFAKEICRCVTRMYNDKIFDFVCYVPSYNKFGYNHSGYIAKEVAKILQIPFYKDLISCIKKTKKQHKSTIKERLLNVEGKYCVNFPISDKKILLIDDIKTTGATLDECSKELLFAGAEEVCCATVLGSVAKEKFEK